MRSPINKSFLTVLILLSTATVFGQAIKVGTYNTVGIAGDPVSTYELYVHGSLYASDDIVTAGTLTAASIEISGTIMDPTSSGQLKIYHSPRTNVGIGIQWDTDATLKLAAGSNMYALKIEGEGIIYGGVWQSSSAKLKKEITDLDKKSMLAKVMQLQAKSYQYKNKEELTELHNQGLVHFQYDTIEVVDKLTGEKIKEVKLDVPSYPKRLQIGLIAEEVEQVFPEAVMTDSVSNTLAINYTTLIPVLIEAIKEQEEQIADLRKETEALKELLNQKE